MTEKRSTPRRRVLKSGSILFGGGAIDCVIRNESGSGAALEVASPLGVPTEFDLMEVGSDASRHCLIVWRTLTRIGVKFL